MFNRLIVDELKIWAAKRNRHLRIRMDMYLYFSVQQTSAAVTN